MNVVKIISLFLILLLSCAIAHADSDVWSQSVTSTISTSKALNVDLVDDFGPNGNETNYARGARFLIHAIPATTDAILQLQCTLWDSTSESLVATTINVNEGAALLAGVGHDFDYIMSHNDGVCNLQATSGVTQLWTVTVKKSTTTIR